MKKSILFFLLFSSVLLSCKEELPIENDYTLYAHSLVGNVKEVEHTIYSSKNAKLTKNSNPTYRDKKFFSRNGLMTKSIRFNADTILYIDSITYSSQFNPMKVFHIKNGMPELQTEYHYNDGELLTRNDYSGKLIVKTINYTHDSNGRVIKCEYTEDDQNVVEEISYNSLNEPTNRKYYVNNTLQKEVITSYNRFHKPETIIDVNGKLRDTVKLEYDENGNCTLIEYFDENGETYIQPQEFEYKHDGQGNWIEQETQFPNGEFQLYKRTISYY